MSMPSIKTERFDLRPLTLADADRVALLAGDFAVARTTARIPHPYTRADAESWLSLVASEGDTWAIDHQGTLIGCCGFARQDAATLEIGYWLGRPWWGRGFATEAVGALVNTAFGRSQISSLVAGHFADNPASGRVLEKNGFVGAGESALWCVARGEMVPTLLYVLARESWRARA